MKLQPGRMLDRYRVDTLIGEGGFSEVYRVRHLALDRDFALKLLKLDRSDLHGRLLQEGRVQAKLEHPNVVAVRDVVEIDGVPGLVLDLVEGGSLDRLLDRHRPSMGEIDFLARGILAGVAAAHELGLVHRDLKPSNVLLEQSPDGFVPKVADFGLARALMPESGQFGATATRSGIMMGTPSYMAPEQIENATAADGRSDIFALGSVLYELVCGQMAFDGPKLADILYYVANVHYRPLEEIVPGLPDRMRLTIEAALQERPGDRVQTVAEMFEMWCGDVEVPIKPSRTVPGFRRPTRPQLPVLASRQHGQDQTLPSEEDGSEGRPLGVLLWQMVPVAALTAALSAALVLRVFGASRSSSEPGGLEPLPISNQTSGVDPIVAATDNPGPPPPPTEDRQALTVAREPRPERPSPKRDAVIVARPPVGRVPAAKPAATGATVVVAGEGVRTAVLVRRADGQRVPPGAGVPDGLYDVVVSFVDEPDVAIDLALPVRDGGSWIVTCDTNFYTCATREEAP